MKKSIVAALVGVATITSYGQGVIGFSNYQTPPYNQVIWTADTSLSPAGAANMAVSSDLGLEFQLYYGKGVVTDPAALTGGEIFGLTTASSIAGYDPGAGHGPGGYFVNVIQVLPDWAAGDTYTFMYKVVSQGYQGDSILWQQGSVPTGPIDASANPPQAMTDVPGLTVSIVPEPGTLAIAGLGAAALLVFRRRRD